MTDENLQPVVQHDPERNRYVILVDGEVAGFAEYHEASSSAKSVGVRDFDHTVVHEAFRGQGLSRPLIAEALDATREAGLQVVPSCSAVASFIEKTPEYQDLVVEGWKEN